MNLVKFIDNRFQELKMLEMEEDLRKEYSVPRHSETLALEWVLRFYRNSVKWLMVPKVLGHFIGVKLGLSKEPEPVMLNKLKLQEEQKKGPQLVQEAPKDEILPNPSVS